MAVGDQGRAGGTQARRAVDPRVHDLSAGRAGRASRPSSFPIPRRYSEAERAWLDKKLTENKPVSPAAWLNESSRKARHHLWDKRF